MPFEAIRSHSGTSAVNACRKQVRLTSGRKIFMATGSAGGTDGLHGRGKAGFGAEAFAEILLQIQP
ncbi:MAG: hypothetical protein DWI22_10725 [Planctomycetota bacterium]|nr:MAG: hypothetical protein DWI22_10725 [Planctomycetota bacterium]